MKIKFFIRLCTILVTIFCPLFVNKLVGMEKENLPNRGLENLGNTCFMNATIQALSNVGLITEYLLRQTNIQDAAVDSYIKLTKELRTSEQNAIIPIDFLSQNLGTLNKNRIQRQISNEISTKTAGDENAITKLRAEKRQLVIKALPAQERTQYETYTKTLFTNPNYNKIYIATEKIIDKINEQTKTQLEQSDEYAIHISNIEKIKSDIFANHKNTLSQYYGTPEAASRMFNTSSQQDAAEFLGEILNNIIASTGIQNISLKTIKSDICNVCKKETTPPGDTFSIFNLPVPNDANSLKQCLNTYIHTSEEIEKNCSSTTCKEQNRIHTRTTKIQEAPDIIFIQLNRFARQINPETAIETTIKISKPITFPLQLNIKDYLINPNDQVYTLIGFVCHIGETANGGHYISYAKDYKNQNWYLYDDEIRKPIENIADVETLGYVKTGHFKKNPDTGENTNIDAGIDQTPYILFYQRQPTQAEQQKRLEKQEEAPLPLPLNEVNLITELPKDGYSSTTIKAFMDPKNKNILQSDRNMLKVMYKNGYRKNNIKNFKANINKYIDKLNKTIWLGSAKLGADLYRKKLDNIFNWLDTKEAREAEEKASEMLVRKIQQEDEARRRGQQQATLRITAEQEHLIKEQLASEELALKLQQKEDQIKAEEERKHQQEKADRTAAQKIAEEQLASEELVQRLEQEEQEQRASEELARKLQQEEQRQPKKPRKRR